ncbi:hypothetical protein LTR36_000513 [Oleoguttula mirabilis]|uniref:F-box domain-containing protein n=1 Tax=Oleoguttula mirabilis TaxID=1507867 RepID=A0AAV9JPM1_9PEZI|nr:hypothetical protein LTR36_000513 [Oleoguttula mirabilis]
MTDPKNSLLGLPNELLLRMTHHLPTIKDVLNLRLVCHELSGIAFDAQAKRMRTIYIDLSKSSLQRFSNIRNSPSHAASIREVIYIGALHKLSSEDLKSDFGFSRVVDRYSCDSPLVSTALNLYADVAEEQRELLANGEIDHTLSACLPLLPRFGELTISGRPAVERWHPPRQVPQEAYDRHQSWRHYGTEPIAERPSNQTPEQSTLDELVWNMHYNTRVTCYDSPIRILKYLGSLNKTACVEDIEIRSDLYQSQGSALGNDDTLATLTSTQPFQQAMQHITGLELSLAGQTDSDHAPFPLARTALWAKFFSTMCNVKKLEIWEVRTDPKPIMKAIMQLVTFPKLKTLKVCMFITWWGGPPSRRSERPHHFSTQALAAFICKHGRTLEHLNLFLGSGVDNDTLQPSGDALQALLTSVRASATRLVSATVVENLLPTHPGEGRQRIAGGQHYDASVLEDQRADERKSELGLLARTCGVGVSERTLTANTGSLFFEYDFGPYILRKDGGT